jgi:hypothetical protein
MYALCDFFPLMTEALPYQRSLAACLNKRSQNLYNIGGQESFQEDLKNKSIFIALSETTVDSEGYTALY